MKQKGDYFVVQMYNLSTLYTELFQKKISFGI